MKKSTFLKLILKIFYNRFIDGYALKLCNEQLQPRSQLSEQG